MSTAHKITPDCQPVFPCWLWIPKIQPVAPGWLRYFAKVETCLTPHATHWHPDQPTAPEPVKERQEWDECGPIKKPTATAPDWAEATATVKEGVWSTFANTVPTELAYPATEWAERFKQALDCAEYAWTIIANASGGNWELESKDWQTAAAKWRDESYYPLLALRHHAAQQGGEDGSGRGLPEDVRSFIERVTLHLQKQNDPHFKEAYQLYDKYDVEGWHAKRRAAMKQEGAAK